MRFNLKEIISFKGDKVLWAIIILLMICSVILIYTSTGRLAYNKQGGDTLYYVRNQLAYLLGSLVILFGMQMFSWRYLYRYATLILFVSAILVAIAAFGGDNINGAGRWIRIPFTSITFQPSECAKIAIVIYVARLLSDYQTDRWCEDEALKKMWMPVGVIGLIFMDNFSTSVLITVVCLIMFILGRVRWRLLLKISGVLTAVLVLIITLGIAFPQVQQWGRIGTIVGRLTAFVTPAGNNAGEEQKNYNFQSDHACMAIVQGGLFGTGPGNSIQRNFLPHAYSDFIYAIIVEEYGLIGGGIMFLLYLIILYRAGAIGRKSLQSDHLNPRGAPDVFPALLVFGLGVSVMLQAMIHIGVNVGALPVTGQTLPMVSKGGSSLWLTSMGLGIILSVAYSMTPEGQAAEQKREEYLENMVDSEYETTGGPDEEESPENRPESIDRQGHSRRRQVVREEEERETRDENVFPELEEEGRKVLKELRKQGRRGSMQENDFNEF